MQKSQTISQDEDIEQGKNCRRKFLFLIFLLIFVSISSTIVGYILGQRTAPMATDKIIDTILLTPSKTQEIALPLHLSGKAYYQDGEPLTSGTINIKGTDITAHTDAQGAFFIDNIPLNTLLFHAQTFNGQTAGLLSITLRKQNTMLNTVFSNDGQGGFIFDLDKDIVLLELDIVLDRAQGTALAPQKIATVSSQGAYCTEHYKLDNTDKVIVTPKYSSILQDDTVVVPGHGIIFPDGTFISQKNLTITPPFGDDTTDIHPHLPTNVTYDAQKDRIVTITPNGTEIVWKNGNTTVKLPDGTVLHPQGGLTKPDGTEHKSVDGWVLEKDTSTILPEYIKPNNSVKPTTPTSTATPAEPTLPGEVKVMDSKTGLKWEQLSSVDIFGDAPLLYPGAKGIYFFQVKNSRERDVDFNIKISEQTTAGGAPAMPLQFRLLHSDGAYVIDDSGRWLNSSDLSTKQMLLSANSSQTYCLEWQWNSSNDLLDTAVGTNEQLEHIINIEITAAER